MGSFFCPLPIRRYLTALAGLAGLSVMTGCQGPATPPDTGPGGSAFGRPAPDRQDRAQYEALCQTVRAMPAPVETAALIKRYAPSNSPLTLSEPGQVHHRISGPERAAALGIYGADMAYCTLLGDHHRSLAYLGTIRQLSADLYVESEVDFDRLSQLTTRPGQLDTLLGQMTLSFDRIAVRMQAQDQLGLSMIMAAASWTEGTWLLTQAARRSPAAPELTERVADQRLILDQLMGLLAGVADQDPRYKAVQELLIDVASAYDAPVPPTTHPPTPSADRGTTAPPHIEERGGIPTLVEVRPPTSPMPAARLESLAKALGKARDRLWRPAFAP